MKKFCISILLLLPITAWSDEPEQEPEAEITQNLFVADMPEDGFVVPETEILGPEDTIPLGELIDLQVKPFSKTLEHLHSVSYSWTVLPVKTKMAVWPDGSRVLFGTGTQATKYTVILTASYVYVKPNAAKELTVAQKQITALKVITVGSEQTTEPPTSPDLNNLSKEVMGWTSLVNLDPTTKKQNAADLAGSFRMVAEAIDSGTITDVADIFSTVKQNNEQVLGSTQIAWKPWGAKLAEKLSGLYNSGVKEPSQFSAVWKDIAKGLEAAAK